jgi:rhamnulokinase
MKQNFFAVDLGATSGRTILGTFIEGGLNLEEINRFPNHLIEVGGHFYWDRHIHLLCMPLKGVCKEDCIR